MADSDWIDDIIDGEPSGITDTQWLIIENNIYNTSLPSRTIEDIIERLNDAKNIISLDTFGNPNLFSFTFILVSIEGIG